MYVHKQASVTSAGVGTPFSAYSVVKVTCLSCPGGFFLLVKEGSLGTACMTELAPALGAR